MKVHAVRGAIESLRAEISTTSIGQGYAVWLLAREVRMRPAAWAVRVNMLLVGLTGAGAGAAIMYMADPQEGRRRRARLREMGGRAGGRLVSHPGAIEVTATQGIISLTGRIFEAEIEQVLKGIAAVRGVTAIDNRLQAHADVAGARTR